MARRERDLVRHLARARLAPRGATLPRHERRHVDCFLHVARGFDEHLAGFAADERRELALARREQLADARDALGARRDRHFRPRRLRGGGTHDRPVHVRLARRRERRDDLGGPRRIDGDDVGGHDIPSLLPLDRSLQLLHGV